MGQRVLDVAAGTGTWRSGRPRPGAGGWPPTSRQRNLRGRPPRGPRRRGSSWSGSKLTPRLSPSATASSTSSPSSFGAIFAPTIRRWPTSSCGSVARGHDRDAHLHTRGLDLGLLRRPRVLAPPPRRGRCRCSGAARSTFASSSAIRLDSLEMTRSEYGETADSVRDYCELFKQTFGPVVAIYAGLADQLIALRRSTTTSWNSRRARTEGPGRPGLSPLRVPARAPQKSDGLGKLGAERAHGGRAGGGARSITSRGAGYSRRCRRRTSSRFDADLEARKRSGPCLTNTSSWTCAEPPIGSRTLRGVRRARCVCQGSRHWWGTWTDYRIDAEELIDAGSSVVVVAHERGRGKGSGAPFEQRYAVVTFLVEAGSSDGMLPDKAAALEAAGLRSRRCRRRTSIRLVAATTPSTDAISTPSSRWPPGRFTGPRWRGAQYRVAAMFANGGKMLA